MAILSAAKHPYLLARSATITGAPEVWQNPKCAARRVWWLCAVVINLTLLPVAFSGRAIEVTLTALLIAVLARHDGVVAALGHLTTPRPGYRRHQLIYHLGQLHRAMAIAGIGWLLLAAAQVARRPLLTAMLAFAAAALASMAWTARDSARATRHDRFEAIHHCAIVYALALVVVVVTVEVAAALSNGILHRAVGLAGLLYLVIAVAVQPRMTVRRLPIEVLDVTSDLVVLALPGRRRVGDFLRVSLDGHEWHSFAVSTCGREGDGRCCLVIRRVGDWTDRLALLCAVDEPPATLLVRQQRGFGFMGHLLAYQRPLVIATGAGIGPVLLYLLDHHQPGMRCVWIGRNHGKSVGTDLLERVLANGQVTLVDTTHGRPDIPALVTQYATAADAVFVVSNGPVRDQVAQSCNRLRVPWYGPTFDS